MGELIGYARVSTIDQSTDLQTDALRTAGCTRVYQEKASGTKTDRPELTAALAYMREGDTLVVWRLDRLGRSLPHLIATVGELEERGIGFKSLTESIDTTTATGRLVMSLFCALSAFERDLTVERTKAGLAAAKARGSKSGRKPVLNAAGIKTARSLHEGGNHTVVEIAETLGCSRATVYRALSSS